MVSLQKFIAKQPKTRKETPYVPTITLAQELQVERNSRAYTLYLLYAAVQRRYGKWVIPYKKDKRMRTCFQRLAKKIDELKVLGFEINDSMYMLAHKRTYGDELRPNHLISWCSLDIYQGYLTERHAEVLKLSEDEVRKYDDNMINYLSNIRGESKKEIKELLESLDLL